MLLGVALRFYLRIQCGRRKDFFQRMRQKYFSRNGPTMVKYHFTNSETKRKTFFYFHWKVNSKRSNFKIQWGQGPLYDASGKKVTGWMQTASPYSSWGSEEGSWHFWILKFDIFLSRLQQKGCFRSFEWVKLNFTIFGRLWKIVLTTLEKSTMPSPMERNASDAHRRHEKLRLVLRGRNVERDHLFWFWIENCETIFWYCFWN